MVPGSFLLAAAGAHAAAFLFYPMLLLSRFPRCLALIVLATVPVLCPLLFHGSAVLRFVLAAAFGAGITMKMYDLHIWAGRGLRPGLWQFATWLPNMMWLVYGSRPPAADGREWSRLVRRAAGSLLAVAYGVAVFSVDWTRLPFALEHAAKAIAFYCVAMTLTLAAASVWRLCGGHAFDPIDHAAGAATPGEFWRRWNRPVHRWVHVHVFEPAGGCRAPARATLAAFAFSGVIHEYVFGIAGGRVRGYQVAFFMLQGVAVVLTMRARPHAPWAWVCTSLTFLFALASSVLFFASFQEIVPFYSRGLPRWMW